MCDIYENKINLFLLQLEANKLFSPIFILDCIKVLQLSSLPHVHWHTFYSFIYWNNVISLCINKKETSTWKQNFRLVIPPHAAQQSLAKTSLLCVTPERRVLKSVLGSKLGTAQEWITHSCRQKIPVKDYSTFKQTFLGVPHMHSPLPRITTWKPPSSPNYTNWVAATAQSYPWLSCLPSQFSLLTIWSTPQRPARLPAALHYIVI